MTTGRIGFALGLVVAGGIAGFGLKVVLAAGIPTKSPLYYSGTLTENGQLVNTPRSFAINVWANATPTMGESALCATTVPATPVMNGRFRVPLDATCRTAVSGNPDAYVEVVVGGTTSTGRSKIGAVPYAVEADHAVNATNAATATTAGKATSMAAGAIRIETNCPATLNAYDCTCASGEVAISGGAYSGATNYILNASQAGPSIGLSAQTWRVSCDDNAGNRVACASPFAVCLAVQ